ncbi:MAG: ubiquinol-cytochrome c reductase iron-sulfur subunit [Azoarcus sp.]|jgi:ubiquinol-cytochrome c reductase iron-sulfur subunit|nr:ubiquinol-cytochrome c reductase iron-sulfur subunit [Azoarcus sp.]
MSDQKKGCDSERRNLLVATSVLGGAAVTAAAVPFVASLAPSERAKAIGAPVIADISKLAPGEKMVVKWRGKPVWILRRTPEMLASLEAVKEKLSDPDSEKSAQPAYAKNAERAINKEYLVAVGICTHLGCSPTDKLKPGTDEGVQEPGWQGGFLCPCHGSLFDLAGRVFKGQPAPTNLEIPPHMFDPANPNLVTIGVDPTDSKGA